MAYFITVISINPGNCCIGLRAVVRNSALNGPLTTQTVQVRDFATVTQNICIYIYLYNTLVLYILFEN